MDKNKIIKELKEKHTNFIYYLETLTKEAYELSKNNKWNANQHLDHIIKSVAVLSKAFSYPKWLLKYKFGKANRPSRSKEALIKRYFEKLKKIKGTPTPSPFQPRKTIFIERENTLDNLQKEVNKLIKRSNKYTDKKLDYYILPHPLLGYLTLREMLYFTTYHVEHHLNLIKRDLK